MKGRRRYIIEPLYGSISQIQNEFALPHHSHAQAKALEYINLGREVERIKQRLTLEDIFRRKRR